MLIVYWAYIFRNGCVSRLLGSIKYVVARKKKFYSIYAYFIMFFFFLARVRARCMYASVWRKWPTNIRSLIYFISRKFDWRRVCHTLHWWKCDSGKREFMVLSFLLTLLCPGCGVYSLRSENLIRITIYANSIFEFGPSTSWLPDWNHYWKQAGKQTAQLLCHRLSLFLYPYSPSHWDGEREKEHFSFVFLEFTRIPASSEISVHSFPIRVSDLRAECKQCL